MHTVCTVPFVDRQRFVSVAVVTLSDVQFFRKVKTTLNQVFAMFRAHFVHVVHKVHTTGKPWICADVPSSSLQGYNHKYKDKLLLCTYYSCCVGTHQLLSSMIEQRKNNVLIESMPKKSKICQLSPCIYYLRIQSKNL